MGYLQKDQSNNRHVQPLLTLHPFATAILSPRETQVLLLMCQECSTKQIAHQLKISPETVNTHKKALRRKTGSLTEVGVVIFAVKNNLFLLVIIISCFDDIIIF